MNPSFVGIGTVIVTLLNIIFPIIGVEVDRGSIEQSVFGLINFIGFVILIIGQIRRKDSKFFIFKK